MKKAFSMLLLITAIASNAQEKPVMTKSLPVGITALEVETSGGHITVAGTFAETRAELYAKPGNSYKNFTEEEIKEKLKNEYDITFEIRQNQFVAVAKSKRKTKDWDNALSISFKIYTGKNVSTHLTTSGGHIHLSGVTGTQEFSTSGGHLSINNVSGKINGTTSGGHIKIENSANDIDLTTSGGNVEAASCTGKIKLVTSVGNIRLTSLNGNISAVTSVGNVGGEALQGQLNASTSGGNIQLSKLSCGLEASSNGGDIRVSFAKLEHPVRITNSAGDVKLELPKNSSINLNLSADKITTENVENFSGKTDKKISNETMEGKLNGGGAAVAVKSNGGNVLIQFK